MRALLSIIAVFTAATATSACGSAVDISELEPIDDYESWERRVEVFGPVGGHADSYRIIHANDIAETFTGAGLYPTGSTVVKEIRVRNADDTPGDLRYLAIMRKLEEAPPGGALDNGWLFTTADDIDADEVNSARCWKTCHQASPFDGAFLDWSRSGR